ncbi:phage tail tape measure protein [Snodgrassella communis]|uniref:phage tail tape measure protein n=1 Tax=Snodgrassella communis TaxID=2946699 RepID=UPI001EF5409F|nr:phage tail tape measure protein [Snodgrassella communis]
MSSNQESLAKQEASITRMTEEVKKLEQQIKRTAAVAVMESEKAGKSQIRIIQQIQREQQRAADMRLRKEIRSEREIQREIGKSKNAYKNFTATATAAQKQIQHATKASRNSIRELNKELEKSSKIQKNFAEQQKKSSKLEVAKTVGGELIRGGKAAYGAVKPAIDDEKKLRSGVIQAAVKAFGTDKSKSADWIKTQGVKEIQGLVQGLVAKNGGTSQAALNLFTDMLQQDMTLDQVKATIPYAHRTMVGSSVNAGEYDHENTARLYKSLADYGLQAKDYNSVSDHIVASSSQGKFTIAQLQGELPGLLSSAKKAGLTDLRGIDYLISALQTTSKKSEPNDEASKSIKAFLEAVANPELGSNLRKIKDPNASGKYLDWDKIREQGNKQGLNDAQSLIKVCSDILAKDKNYQNLKQKADAGDVQAQQQMEARQDKLLSFIPVDARDAINANLNNNLLLPQINALQKDAGGLAAKQLAVLSSDPERQQEKNRALATLGRSDVVEPLVNFQTRLTELSAEFPALTLAVTALAAAAGSAATALKVLGTLSGQGGDIDSGGDFDRERRKSSRKNGKKTPASRKTGIKSRKIPARVTGKMLGRGNSALAVLGGAYNVYAIQNDDSLTYEEKKTAQIKNATSTAGGLAGSLAGGKVGAAIGTLILPGIGTALGGLVGSLLGGIGGSFIGNKVGDAVTQKKDTEEITATTGAGGSQPITSDFRHAYGFNPALYGQSMFACESDQLITDANMTPSAVTMLAYRNALADLPAIESQSGVGQSMLVQQSAEFQNSFQTIVQELGIRLDKIATILSSQQQVIQNNLTVTLDGRVISNMVSRNQMEMYNRGGAQ